MKMTVILSSEEERLFEEISLSGNTVAELVYQMAGKKMVKLKNVQNFVSNQL